MCVDAHTAHPSAAVTPPALNVATACTVVTRFDRGGAGHLEMLLVIMKQLSRLGQDVPGLGSGAVTRTIHSLTCRTWRQVIVMATGCHGYH